jgi:hypothetical protein
MGAHARIDRPVVFSAPPLAFNRAEALGFTRLSEKLFKQLEDNGSIVGKRLGRNGEVIYARDQLEAVHRRLFGEAPTDIDDEFGDLNG